MDIKTNDPDEAARKVLRWFHGPVERYIKEEQAIVNAVVMTTPFAYTVIGWSAASRDLICQRLQAGIRAASNGDRKVIGNVAAFEFKYNQSGLIIPS